MLTQAELKSKLNYDPDTGVLTWVKTNKRAGCNDSSGYRTIGISGKKYKEHRVIWIYIYGINPDYDLDHVNRIKNDNRINNLRCATEMQNAQNIIKAQKHSKTGILGVSPYKNIFQASIQVNGVRKHLGRFKNIDDAKSAYLKAKKELHIFCTSL